MQINLNQQTQEFSTDGIGSFGELMNCIARNAEQEGSRVLQIRLNGEDITGRDRTHLAELPLDQIRELDVETGDPAVLARSTLYSVADFLESLLKELASTAELFRTGNFERSNQSFVRCLDGLQVFMHSLESCRRLLGLSFELMFVPTTQGGSEISIAENRRRLFEVLDAMIEAQTNQDWILLADLLEYELLPVLQDWRQVIPAVLDETRDAGIGEAPPPGAPPRPSEICDTTTRS